MSAEFENLRQVCFVDMPFGVKTSSSFVGEIDFDNVTMANS